MNAPTTEPFAIQPCAYILEENLQDALYIAIQTLKEREAKVNKSFPDFRSTFRAGLESNLAAMRAGQSLEIR